MSVSGCAASVLIFQLTVTALSDVSVICINSSSNVELYLLLSANLFVRGRAYIALSTSNQRCQGCVRQFVDNTCDRCRPTSTSVAVVAVL